MEITVKALQLDFVYGKSMICFLCLCGVAAGSMPVTCMWLWTKGKREIASCVRLTGNLTIKAAELET